MRWLLARVGVMFMVVALLLVGVRLVGAMRQSNITAILDEGAKLPQACWWGICPGQHNVSQVESILSLKHGLATRISRDGNRSVCWYDAANPSWLTCANRWPEISASIEVNHVQLDLPTMSKFKFGDAVLVLGQPVRTYMCIGGQNWVRVGLAWENGIAVHGISIQDSEERMLRADAKILKVSYLPVAFHSYSPSWDVWHGFGRAKNEVEDCRY